ncbi:MAG: GspH/FimT family pseudopilin [Halioglobus sp.]
MKGEGKRNLRGLAINERGFTLVELMMVLAILAALTMIAVPSFRGFIVEQRAMATLTDLKIALMTARSEAVKRNRSVEVKAAAADDWNSGWTIENPDPALPDLLNHAQPGSSDVVIELIIGDKVGFKANGRAEEVVDFRVKVGTGSSSVTKCLKLDLAGYLDDVCP